MCDLIPVCNKIKIKEGRWESVSKHKVKADNTAV
jgi:hypothetical protein